MFFNTSGEKDLGRHCNTMPKGTLILQFHSGLPTSGKEAKPEDFNPGSRVILIQCFVNRYKITICFVTSFSLGFVEASQY